MRIWEAFGSRTSLVAQALLMVFVVIMPQQRPQGFTDTLKLKNISSHPISRIRNNENTTEIWKQKKNSAKNEDMWHYFTSTRLACGKASSPHRQRSPTASAGPHATCQRTGHPSPDRSAPETKPASFVGPFSTDPRWCLCTGVHRYTV